MGRFALGFMIGATLSATVVLLLIPESGKDLRQKMAARIHAAIEAGQAAAMMHEQELWDDFRQRLREQQAPPSPPSPSHTYPPLPPQFSDW